MKLPNADINIIVLAESANTELRRSILTNDNKTMYKVNEKSLARYRCKHKQKTWAILENNCMLYSVKTPCQ